MTKYRPRTTKYKLSRSITLHVLNQGRPERHKPVTKRCKDICPASLVSRVKPLSRAQIHARNDQSGCVPPQAAPSSPMGELDIPERENTAHMYTQKYLKPPPKHLPRYALVRLSCHQAHTNLLPRYLSYSETKYRHYRQRLVSLSEDDS